MHPTTSRLLLLLAAIAVPSLASAAPVECVMGATRGIPEADAETVADIVCDALRDKGIDVGQPTAAPSGGEAFRVDARPLGTKVFVTLTRVGADGATLGRATLDVNAIEEVPVAAPRLADMVLDNKSASRTATVSTLVGDETRPYQKKGGETLWGLGFAGIAVPGTKVFPGVGVVFKGAFETEDFAVVGDVRIAGGDKTGVVDRATIFSASIDGRYFLFSGGWTPYIGAGLGWSAISLETEDGFDNSETGMGANAEIGLEFLRFYRSRLTVDARIALPFFEVKRPEETRWDWRSGEETVVSAKRARYVTPITFGLTYMW